ncbi:hypothetical protein BDV96DRAFT_654379 [Lophiotrema nucula]|uniref:RING-type E3 ubiquitin transferase n=1 Tax=Lophiotrema nucula TaxID=690887 RepID=A0A6A5YKY5_9PLEO|nr:hypothetical protein BDV96DRAFT_654379 [Lophiotrema nucula]
MSCTHSHARLPEPQLEHQPLPDLAEILRSLGGEVSEMHAILNILGHIAGNHYEENGSEEELQRCVALLNNLGAEVFDDDGDFAYQRIDLSKIWELLSANRTNIGDARRSINGLGSMTRGKAWFLRGVTCPEADPTRELKRMLEPVLCKQLKCGINAAEEMDGMGSHTNIYDHVYPSLEKVLRPFISADKFDGEAVFQILRHFLWLGMQVADTHVYYGPYRGSLSIYIAPTDDEVLDFDHICTLNEDRILKLFTDALLDSFPSLSTPVRQALSNVDPVAEYSFLVKNIMPRRIEVDCENKERFGWMMHTWILNAAIRLDPHPDQPTDRSIRELVYERFDTNHCLCETEYYRLPGARVNIYEVDGQREDDIEDENMNMEKFEDVELEAYGARRTVRNYSILMKPDAESRCCICLEEYEPAGGGCARLLVCSHEFHSDCLKALINGVHQDYVTCPLCRAEICGTRPRREKTG